MRSRGGAGTMGWEIVLQCAMNGLDVALHDGWAEAPERARRRQRVVLEGFKEEGRLTASQREAVMARVNSMTDLREAAFQADLLSECVPEKPTLKAQVFGQFNELCPERTVFTSNSSSFVLSKFAEATGRTVRFAALHSYHVVWVSNVVDLMPHPRCRIRDGGAQRDSPGASGRPQLCSRRRTTSTPLTACRTP